MVLLSSTVHCQPLDVGVHDRIVDAGACPLLGVVDCHDRSVPGMTTGKHEGPEKVTVVFD